MNSPLSKGRLGRATGLLAGAVALALAAEQFFRLEWVTASIATAALALLLCSYVAYLSAPHVVRWGRLKLLNVPWTYRITREGLVFACAVLVVGAAAIASGNNLLYLVLSAMLAAMLLSGLVSRLGLSGLQLLVSFPDHIFAGQPVVARLRIHNLKRWLPSFSIWVGSRPHSSQAGMELEDAYCAMIAGGRELSMALQATFPRRGRYRNEAIWVRTRFPFSFVERRARLALGQDLVVYPSLEPSGKMEEIINRLAPQWQAKAPGNSHDLYRIRPAFDGDGARFVDWKASARAGGLWVREFTQEDYRRVHVFFDRRIPAGSEWHQRFEQMVQSCAAFTWRLHAMNATIHFSSDDGTMTSAPNSSGIYEILRYLGLVDPVQTMEQPSPVSAGRLSPDDPCQIVFTATSHPEVSALESSEGHGFLLERL